MNEYYCACIHTDPLIMMSAEEHEGTEDFRLLRPLTSCVELDNTCPVYEQPDSLSHWISLILSFYSAGLGPPLHVSAQVNLLAPPLVLSHHQHVVCS